MARSHESKLTKLLRTVLSFILAIIISILSLAICFNTSILKERQIEKQLTSYTYTEAVRADLISYTSSVYARNNLDYSELDSVIKYDMVNEALSNYAGHYISHRTGYDEDAHLLSIDEQCARIKEDIAARLDSIGINDNERVDFLINSIKSYYIDIVEIKGVDKLASVFNVGIPATYGAMGVSAFFFIFITLILAFLGEKRSRSIRAISVSFFTSGVFQICLALIVNIISQVKKLDIYPAYFGEQIMAYFHYSVILVASYGGITVLLALAIGVLAWQRRVRGK